jgi:hypothetical protein
MAQFGIEDLAGPWVLATLNTERMVRSLSARRYPSSSKRRMSQR